MKLSTGREVKLKDISMAQREECEDATIRIVHEDGSIEIKGLSRTRNLWAMYGLDCELEALSKYTSAELDEIMLEVGTKAGVYKDPTEQES